MGRSRAGTAARGYFRGWGLQDLLLLLHRLQPQLLEEQLFRHTLLLRLPYLRPDPLARRFLLRLRRVGLGDLLANLPPLPPRGADLRLRRLQGGNSARCQPFFAVSRDLASCESAAAAAGQHMWQHGGDTAR